MSNYHYSLFLHTDSSNNTGVGVSRGFSNSRLHFFPRCEERPSRRILHGMAGRQEVPHRHGRIRHCRQVLQEGVYI